MIVTAYDSDESLIGGEDLDYMGYSIINLDHKNLIQKEEEIHFPEPPRWHKVYFDKYQMAGKLLLNFSIV